MFIVDGKYQEQMILFKPCGYDTREYRGRTYFGLNFISQMGGVHHSCDALISYEKAFIAGKYEN